MPIKSPKDVCLFLLSDVYSTVTRETAIYQEMSQLVQDPDIKAAIESRAFLSQNMVHILDECFKILKQQPTKTNGRLRDIFMEDFKKEFNEIQAPIAKGLFVLAKIQHLTHFRIGEYAALVAAADTTGEHAAALLIESCLAQHLVFAERTRHIIRNLVETRNPVKSAA